MATEPERMTARHRVAGVLAWCVGATAALYVVVRYFQAWFGPSVALNASLVVAIALTVAGPLAGWALLSWPRSRRSAVGIAQLVAVGLLSFGLVLAALLTLRRAFQLMSHQQDIGVSSRDVAVWFAATAVILFVLALVLATLRTGTPLRLPVRVTAAMASIAALGSFGSAVAVAATTSGCDHFRFRTARWERALAAKNHSDAATMTNAVARCHTLRGLSRPEVRRLLHLDAHDYPRATRHWVVEVFSEDNPGFGPDVRNVSLSVHFGGSGRVILTRAIDETHNV
jgi:hypothetical protein